MATQGDLEGYDYVVSLIRSVISKYSVKSLTIEDIAALSRDTVFNEKLLKAALNDPRRLYLELRNYAFAINSIGITLIKALSVAELLAGVEASSVNPHVLVKELRAIHPFMERFNPLVITYLYVKSPDTYIKLIYEPIRAKTTLYEFNPASEYVFVFRDYFMHTSIGIQESMNRLYAGFIDSFGNALSNISVHEQFVLTGFRSYLRVLKGLVESLNTLLYAYDRSRVLEDGLRSQYDSNILTHLYLYHAESRRTFASNIRRLVNLFKSITGADDPALRESIILAIKRRLGDEWLFEKTVFDVLCFIYSSTTLMDRLTILKDIDYDVSKSIEETMFMYELTLNEVINDKQTYLDKVAKLLSITVEPYLSLKKRLYRVKGRLPSWLTKLL